MTLLSGQAHLYSRGEWGTARIRCAANLRTKILDFRGFDSSIILI